MGWSWTPADMSVTRLFDVMRERPTFRPAWTLRRWNWQCPGDVQRSSGIALVENAWTYGRALHRKAH
jgi:hypothetical protein